MANTSTSGGRQTPARKPFNWKPWAIGGLVAILVLGGGFFLYSSGNKTTTASAATLELAKKNAGTDVKVFTGTNHTVYHSIPPLPTSSSPQADGKVSLVWFSGTSCDYCEQMEPWAHEAASTFAGRMHFVEKGVAQDNEAAHYGVRGTPTFILIDAQGKALGSFGFQKTREAFVAAIEGELKKAGV